MTSTSFRQTIGSPLICEKTTAQLQLQLTDENDVALASGNISSLTATLYEKRTGTILNSRNAQTILGANGGTVSAGGLLTLILSNADNVLVSQGRQTEEHVLLLEWTWSTGSRFGKKEITYTVANQAKVT